ncbi:efflux RND transporter permease subunit [Candidatus Poriferisocius sp.]|uniref:efflux RND transporter permease subunit n=1 Tax=Candidatus Poriferisocius sp. TaxID=3101276 RepID=UPI003B5A405B
MFHWQARIIRRSPQLVLLALGAVTLALLAGFLVRDRPEGPIDSTGIFLPADSELAEATDAIRESFPAAADLRVVQILAKGDVLTAESLRTVRDLQTAITSHPEIAPFLVDEPIYGYVQLIELAAADAGLSLDTITDIQVALGLAQMAQDPEQAELNDLLSRFVARDDAGTPLAGLSLVILDDVGDALGQERAQLRAHEIAKGFDAASLDVTIITLAKSDAEGREAREENLVVLTVIALVFIVVLLALFYRTQSDVHITMLGLGMTILWTLGAISWLSPGGVGIVDPDNILLTLVPVLLISLSVDYALQIIGRYREALRDDSEADDDASGRAIARSVRLCGVPVLLAAGTTAVSLLANLSSRFEPIADFGLIASIGVISGWIVMTSFVPAARLVLDRRLVAKGKKPTTRPVADTIPGAAAVLPRIATAVVRRPIPVLGAAIVVTALAVVAAGNLSTTFAVKDFLPKDSDTFKSFDFLEENFDGSATLMTVLIETDLDSSQAVQDLTGLHSTLVDSERRPNGIVGPPLGSAGTLLADWTSRSGQAGDNYDADVAAAFENLGTGGVATEEEIRQAWEMLRRADPGGFAEVIDLRSDGLDRTIIQIPVAVEDNEALQELIDELESLWGGSGGEITVTGGDALIALITEELAASQALSVGLVIAAALAILVAYFGISRSRPALGLVTIIPIAVTLAWLLGAMWVFGISYNMGTALMVVLTIGIGVDYTIHLTHRFLEEHEEADQVVDGIRNAMTTTGGALLASALTTALGLLALLFSPLVPMQELGILAAVAILFGLIATFTVLPSLLVLWARYHRWRAQRSSLTASG